MIPEPTDLYPNPSHIGYMTSGNLPVSVPVSESYFTNTMCSKNINLHSYILFDILLAFNKQDSSHYKILNII